MEIQNSDASHRNFSIRRILIVGLFQMGGELA